MRSSRSRSNDKEHHGNPPSPQIIGDNGIPEVLVSPPMDTVTPRVKEKPAAVTRYVYVPGGIPDMVKDPPAFEVVSAIAGGDVAPLDGSVEGALMPGYSCTVAFGTAASFSAFTTTPDSVPCSPLVGAMGISPRSTVVPGANGTA